MKKIRIIMIISVAGAIFSFMQVQAQSEEHAKEGGEAETIELPKPDIGSSTSLEEALNSRRSIRSFPNTPLSLTSISQLLWAAQGITDHRNGFRTAPSAGALYPLELYIVIDQAQGLSKGVYKYQPSAHELRRIQTEALKDKIASAALGQSAIKEAPVLIIVTGIYERTTGKYGERGVRYVHMEAGHAAQNIYLQAESLHLGTVTIGAFSDREVSKLLHLADGEEPLYIMPVGGKQKK